MGKCIFRNVFWSTAIAVAIMLGAFSAAAGSANGNITQAAFYGQLPNKGSKLKAVQASSRYPKPGFVDKSGALPQMIYKGLVLMGSGSAGDGVPSDEVFFDKVREAIDLISGKAPAIFSLMRGINPDGRRVIYYTGKIGPASFTVWKNSYVVNISSTAIDDDPVFENTVYSLAATLVHELVGHGRQETDGRLWPMYDWCGRDSANVEGVVWQANHKGSSSGFVEYEANLFARWFLETVRGTYPNLNEPAVRRYVKTVRLIKGRFPGWYDERKSAVTLLKEFEGHFQNVCPGLDFTPHPAAGS